MRYTFTFCRLECGWTATSKIFYLFYFFILFDLFHVISLIIDSLFPISSHKKVANLILVMRKALRNCRMNLVSVHSGLYIPVYDSDSCRFLVTYLSARWQLNYPSFSLGAPLFFLSSTLICQVVVNLNIIFNISSKYHIKYVFNIFLTSCWISPIIDIFKQITPNRETRKATE